MARDEEILRTAARLFHERGYYATSMRTLAAAIGIEAPSLYNHFDSKYHVLQRLLLSTMGTLLEAVRAADGLAGPDPARRLTAAMAAYVRFHETHLVEASVAETERRALSAEDLTSYVGMRDRLTAIVREIVRD